MEDARTNTGTYSYNVDNTVSGISYSLASGTTAPPTLSYTYDSTYPRLTAAGGVSFTYIPAGSLGAGLPGMITNTLTGGSAGISSTYDEWGRQVGSNIDGANLQTAVFDSLGRITSVTNLLTPSSSSFTYSYFDPTNRVGTLTYPSATGLSSVYSYCGNTGDERLQTIQNFKGSGSVNLSKFDYTYNAVGTIATWKQQSDSNTPLLWTEGYDAADQLTSAVQTNTGTLATVKNNVYGYDPAGNRTSEQTLGYVTASTFNNLNQLGSLNSTTTFSGTLDRPASLTLNGSPIALTGGTNFNSTVLLPSGTNTVTFVAQDSLGNQRTNKYQVVVAPVTPTYDADGNELTNGTGQTYQWDAKNELTAIIYTAGTNVGNHTELSYDALGRRISILERTGTTVGSGTITSTRQLVWTGGTPAEERDATNTVTKRFYGQGEQIGGTNYYYTRDHLGSVREMVDGSGTIQARYDYDPYGRATLVSGSNLSDFQYAGYYTHQPSGLNLTLFRAYDPNAARWLSRDPYKDAEMHVGPNLYDYVHNNPVNWLDPLGLKDYTAAETQQIISDSTTWIRSASDRMQAYHQLHDNNGMDDFYGKNNLTNPDTFCVNGKSLNDDQFGNYLAGYDAIDALGPFGQFVNLAAAAIFIDDVRQGIHSWGDFTEADLNQGENDAASVYWSGGFNSFK